MRKPHPPEQHQQAQALRQQGHGYKTIGGQLGVSPTTVRRWLDPAFAERERIKSRRRKQRYGGTCVDCGNPTSYSGDIHRPSVRCKTCWAKTQQRKWTRDTIIHAIQQWAKRHGRPPTATDWVRASHDHPAATAIYGHHNHGKYRTEFDSWADAIEAAGYPRPYVGHKMYTHRTITRAHRNRTREQRINDLRRALQHQD